MFLKFHRLTVAGLEANVEEDQLVLRPRPLGGLIVEQLPGNSTIGMASHVWAFALPDSVHQRGC